MLLFKHGRFSEAFLHHICWFLIVKLPTELFTWNNNEGSVTGYGNVNDDIDGDDNDTGDYDDDMVMMPVVVQMMHAIKLMI